MDKAKLRALAEAATPGPWDCRTHSPGTRYGDVDAEVFAADKEIGNISMMLVHGGFERFDHPNYERLPTVEQGEANGHFIAAAHPQAILALLDENKEQAEKIERLQSKLDRVCDEAESQIKELSP